jgi:hypothetical protein
MFSRKSRITLYALVSLGGIAVALACLSLPTSALATGTGPCRLLTDGELAATFGDAPTPLCKYEGICDSGVMGGYDGKKACTRCNTATQRYQCCPTLNKKKDCKPDTFGPKQCDMGIAQYSHSWADVNGCGTTWCTAVVGWTNFAEDPKCSIDAVQGDACP